MPHPSLLLAKPAPTPKLRPPRLRSRPFSSRGSAVSRRRLASPRLAASSLSGMCFSAGKVGGLGGGHHHHRGRRPTRYRTRRPRTRILRPGTGSTRRI